MYFFEGFIIDQRENEALSLLSHDDQGHFISRKKQV